MRVLLMLACALPIVAGEHVFSVEGTRTLLDGRPFLVKGLRVSNALISRETTASLMTNLGTYKKYGVNTIAVYLMGSRFGDVKGYLRDGSLDRSIAQNLSRIIDHADSHGMVVLVGCLYWGDTRAKWDHWTQKEANAAVENTARWLAENNHRNVFLDVDNEGMARAAKGFDNRELVLAAKRGNPKLMVATNYKGDPPPEADLAIHHSNRASGKPYIQSEGSPPWTPDAKRKGYWGDYSKREGLYQYINIGVYTEEMKKSQIDDTRAHLERGDGYMLASTWLQCVPPAGPRHDPGGDGSAANPGVRWWLEYLRDHHSTRQASTP